MHKEALTKEREKDTARKERGGSKEMKRSKENSTETGCSCTNILRITASIERSSSRRFVTDKASISIEELSSEEGDIVCAHCQQY